jgi:hypothetical protein
MEVRLSRAANFYVITIGSSEKEFIYSHSDLEEEGWAVTITAGDG